MENFDELLQKYAELLIKKGINVKDGDNVMIYIETAQDTFGELLAEEAYKAGAKKVYFTWTNERFGRLNYEYMATEDLAHVPDWAIEKEKLLIGEEKVSRLSIVSQDPNTLDGIPTEKIQTVTKAISEALKIRREATMKNDVKWTLAAAASYNWARHIFPDLADDKEACVDKLWEEIFKTCRVYADDPVEAWNEHRDNLATHAEYLNKKQFKALHYKAPGTDMTIGLPKGHIWTSAESIATNGDAFIANMPTEEVFTAPDTRQLDGVVRSTKPLAYAGNLIEGIEVHFKDGKITDIDAEKGGDIMKKLVFDNDGGTGLGEVALVPHSSPISQSNITFYSTLFDENASCHIAIGAAYPFTVEGAKDLSDEELKEIGLNVSNVHVDFMIGSAEMDIDGITADGQEVPIFRQGEWATPQD